MNKTAADYFFENYNYSNNPLSDIFTIYSVTNKPFEEDFFDRMSFIKAVKTLYIKKDCILIGFKELGEIV